jgi:hypothetical protein
VSVAIEVLGEIMEDKSAPPATRVMAADKILDRALGKAHQPVDVTTTKHDALEYSIADLVAIAYRRGMEGGSIDGELVAGEEPGVEPDARAVSDHVAS